MLLKVIAKNILDTDEDILFQYSIHLDGVYHARKHTSKSDNVGFYSVLVNTSEYVTLLLRCGNGK